MFVLVVLLGCAGKLAVLYLGSEPPRQSIAFSESRQLDYAAMEAERRALLAQIKAAGAADWDPAAAAAVRPAAGTGTTRPPQDLVLRAQVPSRLDPTEHNILDSNLGGFEGGGRVGFGGGAATGGSGVRQLTVSLMLSNTTKAALEVRWCRWCLMKPFDAVVRL